MSALSSGNKDQARRVTPLTGRVVALAALIQSVHLVNSIARKGMVDAEDFEASLGSLFHNSPGMEEHPAALYGGLYRLQTGLRLALQLLEGRKFDDAKPLMAYSAGVMSLERKLAKNAEMLERISEGMERIRKQSDYFGGITHENVIAGVAGLYSETLSTMKPRIIVRGKTENLRNSNNTNRVRAQLLCAIRAAYLWRRHGGGHFTLLFGRGKLAREAKALLKEASRV